MQAVSATRERARTRPPGPKLVFGEGADGPARKMSAWRHGRQGLLPRFGFDGAVRHGMVVPGQVRLVRLMPSRRRGPSLFAEGRPPSFLGLSTIRGAYPSFELG